jgi:hypothetical protein
VSWASLKNSSCTVPTSASSRLPLVQLATPPAPVCKLICAKGRPEGVANARPSAWPISAALAKSTGLPESS